MKKKLDRKYLEKAMNYLTFRKLLDDLLLDGKTTGENQSVQLTEYAKLNVARMKRLDKTVEIIAEVKDVIDGIKQPQTWVVITEGWCGDAAQIVPVFYAMAKLNSNINLQLVLRDENLELMDKYLTNGTSRSIPKLIVYDANNNELFNWGARPQALQIILDDLKSKGVSFDELKEILHKWYATDKTISTQKEIAELLK